ncbi:hypothetical protein Trisim1_003136 [Trichoderma cf. simile WF8]
MNMRNQARQYQKQKFGERKNRRVLKSLKEYTARQEGFSTLAQGAKYSYGDDKHHCSLCNFRSKMKDYPDHHKKSKGHLTKEAKANGNTEAAIIYAYYCDLCDYSTNISGSLKAHKRTKAHLAKEAEVRRNANGSTEAAVICKYSCNLYEYSTNLKRKFDGHSKSKAHLAKEAKAHLAKEAKAHLAKEAKAHGSANTGANDKTEAAVVFEYSCDLCDFSTNVKKKFGRHNATQAHRAREAEARLNATGERRP